MSKRILIIDDDEAISELARFSLEGARHWQVLTARSGKDGLASAAAERPDAILLDVMLPDMHGAAILQALRANPATQSIPVVLLTGSVPPAAQDRSAPVGVEAVIAKPFNVLRLAEQIAVALGWG